MLNVIRMLRVLEFYARRGHIIQREINQQAAPRRLRRSMGV